MSDKWYSIEPGVAEQERRADLTKLTADEFCRRIDNCDLDADEHTEVRRRIKRLEQCEAELKLEKLEEPPKEN